MRLFRYVVLLASVGWLVLVLYAIGEDSRRSGHIPPWVFLIPISLLLNIGYVWFSQPAHGQKTSRIGQLFSLWLDAKETELKRRANPEKAPPPSSRG